MAIIKSLISAIATYSKIPMPNISYREGEGRFTLCFFPFVGVVVAGIMYVWLMLCWYLDIEHVAENIGYMLIPLVVTGGIHIDGFMDSMDAIHSYGDRDKKLKILEDPHIGAFCVIKLLELAGIWMIALTIMLDQWHALVLFGFVYSRILSGLTIKCLPGAKTTGMVAYTKSHASPACVPVLVAEFIALTVYMLLEYGKVSLIPLGGMLLCTIYYYFKSKRDFGGITGDTAGCFLVMSETCFTVITAILNIWWMR